MFPTTHLDAIVKTVEFVLSRREIDKISELLWGIRNDMDDIMANCNNFIF